MSARDEFIDRLRQLADLLEQKPDLILPSEIGKEDIVFYPVGAKGTAETARLFPSSWSKNDPNRSHYDAMYYKLTGSWNGADVLILETRSAVCERVQVGTETIEHDAVEASVEERPVFEYQCSPLLAKAVAK